MHKYGEDKTSGKYAECDVLYDDGEMVHEWKFYDEDYGEEVWRFSSHLAPLIDALLTDLKAEEDIEDDDEDEDDDFPAPVQDGTGYAQ